MKRFLPFFLSLLILTGCTEKSERSDNNDDGERSDVIFEETSEESVTPEMLVPKKVNVEISELGIPLSEKYSSDDEARTPNDIVLKDGLLHIGSGEYSRNSGPVEMHIFDTATKEWHKSCELPEEAIIRFCEIQNKIYAPGIDGKESWDLGSYYVFENGTWVQNRVIPGGVHVFDIVRYANRLFFAIGTDNSANAVAMQELSGEFVFPNFYGENGKALQSTEDDINSMRIYDMFVLNGSLFALKNGQTVFRYNGKDFEYFSAWKNFFTVHIGYDGGTVRKTVFNGKVFLLGGWLYCSDNGRELTRINMPREDYVADFYQKDGFLYLLCDRKLENGDFQIKVLVTKSGNEGEFFEYCSFEYPIPAVSFAVGDNALYFGMMDNTSPSDLNGMILEAEIK